MIGILATDRSGSAEVGRLSRRFSVEKEFTILIADRNRRVREFLRREMLVEGYQVRLAGSGQEVLEYIDRRQPVDLIILDPDLPDAGECKLLERVRESTPTLPVIVHTFLSDYVNHSEVLSTTAFVEKDGTSIDCLKTIVLDILGKSYPRRNSAEKGRESCIPGDVETLQDSQTSGKDGA
jgi:DNA-binding NtrC family response regulator